MKKVTAFLTALALFCGTAAGIHCFAAGALDLRNPEAFGAWVSDKKFQFGDAIAANLGDRSVLVFGSSEFSHGTDTPYHPKNLLAGQDFQLMLVGEGYYQSLSHATALSTVAPSMKERKAALILSPQWFRKKGVRPEAYASRFSEWNFIQMLQNDEISQETKSYIARRTEELLTADPPTLDRVRIYEKIFLKHQGTERERAWFQVYQGFLKERSSLGVIAGAFGAGIRADSQEGSSRLSGGGISAGVPDWNAYLTAAEKDGKAETCSNPFGMKNSFYELRIKPRLAKKKNASVHGRYSESPEFDDLKCFLQVCREERIQPMLVLVPVNGPWYDYTGFPKSSRQEYYEKIRAIAQEYGAELADFSGEEYTKYFFEDNVHLGWKGWVKVDESLYRFAEETPGVF